MRSRSRLSAESARRSADALRIARDRLAADDYVRCIRESYDAAFYAAGAVLVSRGMKAGTHERLRAGLVDLAAAGVVPADMSFRLSDLFDSRSEAAYRIARTWSREEAAGVLAEAGLVSDLPAAVE